MGTIVIPESFGADYPQISRGKILKRQSDEAQCGVADYYICSDGLTCCPNGFVSILVQQPPPLGEMLTLTLGVSRL